MLTKARFSGIGLIFAFIALRTVNQVLFKKVAIGPGGNNYFALLSDPFFYLACLVFLAQAVVWLSVLRRFTLSFAYPFTSITFITIMASGLLFFGEAITLGNLLGTLVIMTGVGVIVSTNNPKNTEHIGRP